MAYNGDHVATGRSLMGTERGTNLAVGDLLGEIWDGSQQVMESFCAEIELSPRTGRDRLVTAVAVTPDLRELIDSSGVYIPWRVLREGARGGAGTPHDPGYAKLRELIAEAAAPDGDARVRYCDYQVVLRTAPTYDEIMAAGSAAGAPGRVVDFITELRSSPRREIAQQVLAADKVVTENQITAAVAADKAERKARRDSVGRGTAVRDAGTVLLGELEVLRDAAKACSGRFAGTVAMTEAQKERVAKALDELGMFIKWAKLATKATPVRVPSQRSATVRAAVAL